MPRIVICLTTVSSRREAEKLAKQLVQERLVACVNLIPSLTSFYHWKGKTCRDREVLLLMKTRKSVLVQLEKAIHALHPYELPEFIVLSITGGSRKYLDWISKNVKSGS